MTTARTIMGDETKLCAHCGGEFHRDKRNTWAHWERARYCSRTCVGAVKTLRAAQSRPPMEVVFQKWFERSDGCWLWLGAIDRDGYGIFTYAGQTFRAPKVALQLDGRPVPDGQYACHHCDNPGCVNPAHLYPGTPTQNMRDAIERDRVRNGERNHFAKLSEAAVRIIRSSPERTSVLARRYGVSNGAVELARSGKTWKHVA